MTRPILRVYNRVSRKTEIGDRQQLAFLAPDVSPVLNQLSELIQRGRDRVMTYRHAISGLRNINTRFHC